MSLPCSIIFLWHLRPPQKPFQIPHSSTLGLGFRGGGALNKTSVYTGRLHSEVKPLILLYTIFHEKGTHFVRPLLTNGTPFTYFV